MKRQENIAVTWAAIMRGCRPALLAAVLTAACVCEAQPGPTARPSPAAPIPDGRIAPLAAKLARGNEARSSVRWRLACKGLIREGEALLEAYPAAPNRYRVLGIVFKSQKRLLGLENSDRNRGALFDMCKKLAQAPDEYANLRLEADLLLSERDLTAKGATLQDRAKALAAIVGRYRGTPAEAKSLMMAAQIAPKLEAPALETEVFNALSERFAGDPSVIEFRRKHLGISRLDVLFSGTYTRADGVVLRFPADLTGRLSVMVFWSRKTPDFERYIEGIKKQQSLHPGRFEVFSFNLDELPDAGAGTLSALQLDWTVMRLPGGKKSQAFRTYAQKDPVGILVNAYGHALLAPTLLNAAKQAKLGVRGVPLPMLTLHRRLDDPRYLSQLQSLLIGDVLVTEPDGRLDAALPPELKMVPRGSGKETGAKLVRTAKSVPTETLRAIQKCFTPAPFRYRLATAEALANYTKAEKLCGQAVRQHPAAPDLWIVRNRRIIALLGMWTLTGEPKHLEQAAREARASLAAKLPPGADIIPRFCLAKETLRRGDSKPESVLLDLIEKTAGAQAPCSAHAAAAILALNANARDLHNRYRAALLAGPDGGSPVLWSMVSFLRDRIYTYRLLKANYIKKERESVRSYMINHGGPPITRLLPTLTLKTLDGRTLSLPRDTNGKLTLLVFVEPSADPNAKFPINSTERPKEDDKKKRRSHPSILEYACKLADSHVNKEVNVIAAFLSDDADRIGALMKEKAITCEAAMVPGGLRNPMVRRLGVLSADRIANVYLLRRDGSIAWHASGLPHGDIEEFVALLAMKVHIEACEVETAYEALNNGDFKRAAKVFTGPYLPWDPDRFGWRSPRYHGKALAHMALKDWAAAAEAIDTAIEAHKLCHLRGRRRPARDWRMDASQVVITRMCDVLAELWTVKAIILQQLGRKEEAAALRRRAAEPVKPDGASPYGLFHEKLKKFRLTQQ